MEQEFTETQEGADYRFRIEDGKAVITRCITREIAVSVPAYLAGFPVIELADESFASSRRGDLSLNVANAQLERVDLPEGVVRIGRASFRGCSRLARVTLPDTLEEIGDLAFSCTSVSAVRLPQACVRLADLALRTGPESLAGADSSYLSKLDRIEVSEGNPAYCVEGGVLCRRLEDGMREAVQCPGACDEVILDESVVRIMPAAFAGTYEVGRLRFHETIELVDGCGIAPNATCAVIEIVRSQADGFEEPIRLDMPSEPGQRRILSSTKGQTSFGLEAFLATYDAEVLAEPDRLLQSKLMLARLARPVCLGAETRTRFQAAVERNFDVITIQYGARNYWQGFEDMADAGILDEAAIGRAVDVLTARSDATAVARLLELKRNRFADDGWDYGL